MPTSVPRRRLVAVTATALAFTLPLAVGAAPGVSDVCRNRSTAGASVGLESGSSL